MLIVTLWFSTRLSTQQSNPGFELFSQLIIDFLLSNQESEFSNLDFKTHVFNSQFLTQTYFIFQIKPENGHFQVYFKKTIDLLLEIVGIVFDFQ